MDYLAGPFGRLTCPCMVEHSVAKSPVIIRQTALFFMPVSQHLAVSYPSHDQLITRHMTNSSPVTWPTHHSSHDQVVICHMTCQMTIFLHTRQTTWQIRATFKISSVSVARGNEVLMQSFVAAEIYWICTKVLKITWALPETRHVRNPESMASVDYIKDI